MLTTPEKALEAVVTMLDATSRMVTKNLFRGDQDLHSAFSRWAIQNERAAYVKASEAVARTQSSRPMQALAQKHMAAVKAMQPKAQAPKAAAAKPPQTKTKTSNNGFRIDDAIRDLQAETRRLDRENAARRSWLEDE